MRKRIVALGVLALTSLSSGFVLADDQDGDHGGHAPTAAADPSRGMKDIETLMARISAAPDVDRRQELLTQHLAAMRGQMRLIRAASESKTGPTNQADDPHAAHTIDAPVKTAEQDPEKSRAGMMGSKKMGAMMQKHKRVEQRLDMLERMLQQLIEHIAVDREIEQ